MIKQVLILLLIPFVMGCFEKASKSEEGDNSIEYNPEYRLTELGIDLPEPPSPTANYVPFVQVDDLLFLAGNGPQLEDGTFITGKVGVDLSVEDGYQAARLTGIGHLSRLKQALGNLNKVKKIVKVNGMVNATNDFTNHSQVINGFSDLMVVVFGEAGRHARTSIGVASLPQNIPVEINLVVQIEKSDH